MASSTALLQQNQIYWKIPLCKFHSPFSHSKSPSSSHLLPFPGTNRTVKPVFCFPSLVFTPIDITPRSENSDLTTDELSHRNGSKCSSGFPRKRTKVETFVDISSKHNLAVSGAAKSIGSRAVRDRREREIVNSNVEIKKNSGVKGKSEDDILIERLNKTIQRNVVVRGKHAVKKGSAFSPPKFKGGGNFKEKNYTETKDGDVVIFNGKSKRACDWNQSGEENMEMVVKRSKQVDSPSSLLRVGLEMCSKKGDVMGALELYDSAKRENLQMSQYHYNVLLYLCSSAATGVIHPAKSGSGSRVLNRSEIRVGEDFKNYALERGFEIYEKMCLEDIEMNESSLTSVARLALAMGNGDMAFETVKQMKTLGISPRLRSYGPALSAFCKNGDIDKAFSVEEHMLENNVHPEEPELEALLRVSMETGRADKAYYLLHKLRTSVRKVSPSVANLVEEWFNSKAASRVGKRKWDEKLLSRTIADRGGGWHGEGWLGIGKWTVVRTSVGEDGFCNCCGEKLAIIDLDPVQTENFAQSVVAIATNREKNASFQKFQKWLDYYGPFEAVVDAANVGLLTQRKFKPSKVNAVVNGIRQMLPSKKWPLIILHNRRITGDNMDKPVNKGLVEKWKNADALFSTPTGSNDDWYWLYAAIKYKCLIVTNDEMRDHLFQLLGNDFFPRWKERHQVRFSFSETGPLFQMPPPCSVVIQESENGHWHIPVAAECDSEDKRTWLCITRSSSSKAKGVSADSNKCSREAPQKEKSSRELPKPQADLLLPSPENRCNVNANYSPQETYSNLRGLLLSSAFQQDQTVLSLIEDAESLAGCFIDFQI
ncbi:proteinaceous RNase P 1, chloroplastic/mitochondrial-like [Impatiens glandulifera]|uniref:proteinaceous RNase P 1, chloroplastic/mitochondrial-like n=1 Tax=Impatiens glandulifera TaxID=253017 RepID=UPI001FB13CC9|nr:proteinaceous RNase P 1, chloroplastic/mitochondrial-like [Impatiens glandulifera]